MTTALREHNLQVAVSHTKSVEETVGLETTEGTEENWSDSVSVDVSVEGGYGPVSATTTVGYEHSSGGARTWEANNSKSTAKATEDTTEAAYSFSGPGAAIAYEVISEYKTPSTLVPVKLHYKCQDGTIGWHNDTAKYLETSFGHLHTELVAYKLNSGSCTTAWRQCIRALSAASAVSNPDTLVANFKACFANGVGYMSE